MHGAQHVTAFTGLAAWDVQYRRANTRSRGPGHGHTTDRRSGLFDNFGFVCGVGFHGFVLAEFKPKVRIN